VPLPDRSGARTADGHRPERAPQKLRRRLTGPMQKLTLPLALGLGLGLIALPGARSLEPGARSLEPGARPAPAANTTLKDLVPKGLLIGSAINQGQSDGQDTVADAIVERQFNTISPENILKWGLVHPEPERYDFEPADRYVAFGQSHGMAVIGHNLVWHNQT